MTTEAGGAAQEAAPAIDPTLVRDELGLPAGGPDDPRLDLAIDAATEYITRYKGTPAAWKADYRLAGVRLAVGLYRDAAKVGITEAFASSSTYKRATDVQIEQLLQIGRYAAPQVG